MNNSLLRLRILIVDDIPEHCERLKRMISHLDHEIVTTTKIQEAIESVRSTANIYNPFDVAILDYFMPEMNGVELGKELKKIDSDINIIILTADSSKETAKMVLSSDLNIVGFITKKEDIGVLTGVLSYVLVNKEILLSGENSFIRERTARYNQK